MKKNKTTNKPYIKEGYTYKDACPCLVNKKTLYEMGVSKVKRRERRNDRRRSVK